MDDLTNTLTTRESADMRERILEGASRAPRSRPRHVAAVTTAVLLVGVGATAAVWAALAATQTPSITDAVPVPHTTDRAIESPVGDALGEWVLPEDDDAYLVLRADGTAAGYDGCNGLGGTWQALPDGRLELALVTTLIACPEDEWTGLALASEIATVSADGLHVSDRDAEHVVLLERAPSMAGLTAKYADGTTLLTVGQPSTSFMEAIVGGTLVRGDDGCLAADVGSGTPRPLIFPYGSEILDGGAGARVPGIGDVLVGEEFSGGGGQTEWDAAGAICATADVTAWQAAG